MTREEALKIWLPVIKMGVESMQECSEALDMAIKALEQTRWIPIREQLPKKSGNYWCTFGGTNIVGIDYYTTESDAKEIFDDLEDYDPEDYEYAGWRSQNVVAWMPLPQPYVPDTNVGKMSEIPTGEEVDE